jgi:uncharacterized membrane protein
MSEPSVPPPPSYTPPPPPPPTGTGAVSPNRTLWIILSYLGIFALIPLLMEKDDREVQWHAKHGLVLLGAEIVLWIGLTILSFATAFMHLGCAGCVLNSALLVVILIVHILCIVKGINGERFIIPGLSQFADRF